MEAYEGFASVYDILRDDVDYDMWFGYIKEICKKEGLSPKLALDLGCGTGNMTRLLAKEGIEMIGIDISEQMLSEATKKAKAEGLDIEGAEVEKILQNAEKKADKIIDMLNKENN